MYSAEHFGHTMVFPGFCFSSMKLLKELLQDFLRSFDEVNRAMTDGKALDQLQDRLAGLFSVNDVIVRGGATRHSEELDVDVHVPDKITPVEKLRIKVESIKVNLRYGSRLRIHVIVDNRGKE